MTTNPHISLVFVNYHSVWQLSLALQKLFALELEQDFFEVIVVNNDGYEERALRRLSEKLPLRLFSMPENVGFGRGANIGAREARGSILGFLNPDTEWQQQCLRQISDVYQESTPAWILGLQLSDEKGRRELWSGGMRPSLLQLLKNNVFSLLPKQAASSDGSLDWVSGGGLFVPKETFQSLGGFDERFFLYFEDVDLCLRAKKQGVTLVSSPRFTLLHRGGKSFSSSAQKKKCFYTSQIQYFEKHRPSFEVFCLRGLHRILHGL